LKGVYFTLRSLLDQNADFSLLHPRFVGPFWATFDLLLPAKRYERDRALAEFTSGEKTLMFATDVAARGLDIKGVTHVINFDMARDVEVGETLSRISSGCGVYILPRSDV
jgi:hypothetical protein